jgi:predicted DsbA family dithiol-disulfide isomerase
MIVPISLLRRSHASRVLAVLFACVALVCGPVAAHAESAVAPVPVQLYVMSQCPYALGAEASVAEVVAKLGPSVALELDYIGDVGDDGALGSMHGPDEVKGDIAQLCAQKHTPRWLDFLVCQNREVEDVATNWETCAAEVGADVERLRACIEGDEGKKLAAESFRRAEAREANGSPTFFIGGKRYEGGRKPSELGRAICAAFPGAKPEACRAFPLPPRVHVTILGDSRCEECDDGRLERVLQRIVGNPVVQRFDYATPEGKRLFAALGPTRAKLPLATFDVTLDADQEALAVLRPRLSTKGTFRILDAGGSWNPVCADPGGCSNPDCKAMLACRPLAPRRLEVFVMSHCPFCLRGLASMREVLANFRKAGAPIDFRVHFIGSGDAASGLASMHGEEEVAEDLREICAAKAYAANQKFLEYVWCRNRDLDNPNWRACATPANGIDAGVLAACAEGPEGKKLLAASFAYADELGIRASPTWLVNGRHRFSGLDAETLKTEYCKHNPGPGCDVTLSSEVPEP